MSEKFRKFKQNKLWRDKAVDLMQDMGSKIHWEQLDNKNFITQLKLKIVEEAQEVHDAQTPELLKEELADVLEVLHAFCAAHEITLEQIDAVRKRKKEKRGGFEGRRFITIAEHQEGSFGEAYCLKEPKKYPEVF